MRRVPDVIDCWFDTGAMPFAQWGYPHQPGSPEQFRPAVSRRLHQRGHRSDPRLVLQSAGDQHAAVQRRGDGGRGKGEGGGRRGKGEADPQVAARRSPLIPNPQSLIPPAPRPTPHAPRSLIPNPQSPIPPGPRPTPHAPRSLISNPQSLIPPAPRPTPHAPRSLTLNPQSLIPAPSYPHPFSNCIVLGLMLGEDGGKMSKSKRNYREPNEIFDRYGADALRWYFFCQSAAVDLDPLQRAGDQGHHPRVPAAAVECLQLLRDLCQHRRIRPGGGDSRSRRRAWGRCVGPGQGISAAERSRRVGPLDPRRTQSHGRCGRRADGRLRQFRGLRQLTEFVDALSNWYVRRSRDRFWSSGSAEDSADKSDAHWTLYECLLTTCKLIAPFVPFLGRGDVAEPGRSGLRRKAESGKRRAEGNRIGCHC